MKKILLFNFILCTFINVHAQTYINTTVFTPRGTPVEGKTLTSGELTSALISAWRIQTLTDFPNATFLADATRTYNCHGYAWHISEGGSPVVWINQYNDAGNPNVYKYWTDGSYIKVCNEADAEKIHYYTGDHSAIISTIVTGTYESKWGPNIRIRHAPTDVPVIYNGSFRNYYASTKVIGSTANLCSGTRTFSVKNISGATYVWTYSSTLAVVGPINTNQITVQKNGTVTGAAWVSVQITTPCSTTSVNSNQDFTTVGSFVQLNDIAVSYTRNQGNLQTVDFDTLNNVTIYTQTGSFSVTATTSLAGTNSFDWVVTGPAPGSGYGWSNFTKSGSNCSFTLSGTNAPTIPLQVTLTNTQNGCTTSASNNKIVVFVGSIQGASMTAFEVSPNPASTMLNISPADNANQLSAIEKNSITPTIKEIRLIDKMGNIKLTKRYADNLTKTDRINISDLPNDMYTLLIFNGTDWESHKIIKQ